MGPFAP